ncbi:MAG TPA: hypothetical protein VFE72_02825 [Lysobacter sp.]|nr:hypothetical protein [Lysobacter sp.]
MTAIAYDGARIASDGLGCWGDERQVLAVRKIHHFQHGGRFFLAANAGSEPGAGAILAHYFTAQRVMGHLPPLSLPEQNGATVLLVELFPEAAATATRWYAHALCKDGSVIDLGRETAGLGSGSDYCVGAMDAGATALEAVEIAARRNTGCAGPFFCEDVAEWVQRARMWPESFPPLFEPQTARPAMFEGGIPCSAS